MVSSCQYEAGRLMAGFTSRSSDCDPAPWVHCDTGERVSDDGVKTLAETGGPLIGNCSGASPVREGGVSRAMTNR